MSQYKLTFITAPAIISTPHYLDPSYSQRFAEWTDGQLPDAVCNPSNLRLSADHRLIIFLDKVRLILESFVYSLTFDT